MYSECRVKIEVAGHVQGVGFRYATFQKAKALDLTGFVKNLPDHSVNIEVQGKPENVRTFIEWCRIGPGSAIVESIEYSYLPAKESRSFQIR